MPHASFLALDVTPQQACRGWSVDVGFARRVVVLFHQLGEPLFQLTGDRQLGAEPEYSALTSVLLVLGKLREHLAGRAENAATARR